VKTNSFRVLAGVLALWLPVAGTALTPERLKNFCASPYAFDPESGNLGKRVSETEADHVYGRFDSAERKMVYVGTDEEGEIDPSPLVDHIIIDCESAGVERSDDRTDSSFCIREGASFARLKKTDPILKKAKTGFKRSVRILKGDQFEWTTRADGPRPPKR
jgi:hypothetical protein